MEATLTPKDAATMLRVSRERLYDLMRLGALVEGVHYSRPPHMHPRFDAEALRRFRNGELCGPAPMRTRGRQGGKVNLQAVA